MNRHFEFSRMKSYDEWLVEKLRDPKRAFSYLKSEYEEFEIDGDVEALKNALLIYLRSQRHVLNSSVHVASVHVARSQLILALYKASYDSHSSRISTSQRTIVKEGFDNQGQFDDPIEVDVAFGQVAPI